MTIPTHKDVADFMLEQLKHSGELYQENVVLVIKDRYGDDFVYINDNGNYAIDKKVLKSFRDLTGDSVVWERGERLWRFRKDYDPPGRQAE